MKKRIAALTLVLMCIVMSAMALKTRVIDQAKLLSSSEQTSLEDAVSKLCETYPVDLVLVTIDNANGKSARDFADDYYDYNGYGVGQDATGMLFLIDMDNRELYISTTGAMIDVITDIRREAILDSGYEHLVSGNYYRCFQAMLSQTEQYITQSASANDMTDSIPYNSYRSPERQDRVNPFQPKWILLSIGVGLIATVIFAFIISSRYKRAFAPVAYDVRKNTNLSLSVSQDNMIDSHTVKRYDPPPKQSSGGGSSGRSTTHTSSSGGTHGGGGRSF